jgi:hypothetical protein
VRYNDGDEEDYSWGELVPLLKAKPAAAKDKTPSRARRGSLSAMPKAGPGDERDGGRRFSAEARRTSAILQTPQTARKRARGDASWSRDKDYAGGTPRSKRRGAPDATRHHDEPEPEPELEPTAAADTHKKEAGEPKCAPKADDHAELPKAVEAEDGEDEEEMTDYERQRQANIRRNAGILAGLGITHDVAALQRRFRQPFSAASAQRKRAAAAGSSARRVAARVPAMRETRRGAGAPRISARLQAVHACSGAAKLGSPPEACAKEQDEGEEVLAGVEIGSAGARLLPQEREDLDDGEQVRAGRDLLYVR